MRIQFPQTSRKALKHRSNICLNCERPLKITHRYCPYCGQVNSTKKLSLSNYFGEFLSSIFNYDSKIRYTLQDLLLKPGTITLRYIKGKRYTYANPFRFYLSISIIYFIISGFLDFIAPKTTTSEEFNIEDIFNGLESQESKLVLDSIKYYRDNYKTLNTSTDTTTSLPFEYVTENELSNKSFLKANTEKINLFQQFASSTQIENPSVALDSLEYNQTRLNLWMYERGTTFNKIKKEPLAFFNYVTKKIPLFLFFFTPFFAFFFVLIYFKRESFNIKKNKIENYRNKWFQKVLQIPFLGNALLYLLSVLSVFFCVKRERTYIEHVILIFHVFTFIFLGLILLMIPDFILGKNILTSLFFAFVGPIYFYKALRNFYKEGRLRTIIKFLFLNFVFLVLLSLTGFLFIIVTAATY